ncbi:MAG: Nit6803 family nitriliase [Verrucomicrobia bacterium]|nr:Nit6803 family nitriliase [Verrucomicrobiota bacterium]
MKRFKAAAVQLAPDLTSVGGTVERVCRAITDAGEAGAKLIVFPETFIPYYPYFSFVLPPVLAGKEHLRLYENAVRIPGPVTDRLSEAAARSEMIVVAGVNERAEGTLYNTQLVFGADGKILSKRRKITPSYHERMIWGQGDGSGFRIVQTEQAKIGVLACWEHYNPLARFALMAEGEEVHCSQFPGSMVGQIFADQIAVTIRHHALEAGCFVINSTGWLTDEQIASITPESNLQRSLRGGCHTAIISPEGNSIGEVITEGEGMVVAELDPNLVTKRKRMLDAVGHYARPDLFTPLIDRETRSHVHPMHRLTSPIPSQSIADGSHESHDQFSGISNCALDPETTSAH